MKFFIYNVPILTCCLFIFSSCKKSSENTTSQGESQEETQSLSSNDEVQVETSKDAEASKSTVKLPSEKNSAAPTVEIKQPEISIPQEPEEVEEEESIATPAEVLAFVGKMKESGIPKLVAELEELEDLGRESPGLAFEALKELATKASALDAGDLPEDLRNEFDALTNGLNQMVSHLEASPIPADIMAEGREAIGRWWFEQSQADPDFEKDMGEVMQSWGSELQELRSTLDVAEDNVEELFEKYGVDDSELEN